jgi:hypothetical protein
MPNGVKHLNIEILRCAYIDTGPIRCGEPLNSWPYVILSAASLFLADWRRHNNGATTASPS